MPELVIDGLDKILDGLTIKVPSLLRKMAYNVDANLASEGRIKEEKANLSGSRLRMGLQQRKGFWSLPRVRSEWDPKVGWVSTTRAAGKGGTGYRMASFGWERAKKYAVTAPYSNQMANLWHRPTKPYRGTSPLVGTPGHYMRWRQGSRRDARYNWSITYSTLTALQGSAIARTEAQYSKKLQETIE